MIPTVVVMNNKIEVSEGNIGVCSVAMLLEGYQRRMREVAEVEVRTRGFALRYTQPARIGTNSFEVVAVLDEWWCIIRPRHFCAAPAVLHVVMRALPACAGKPRWTSFLKHTYM